MKQIFYIIALFLAFFFSNSDCNIAYGQNMAQESYIPWPEADKTGEYYMERCDTCDIWITGYTKDELRRAWDRHISARHPNIPQNKNTDTFDTGDNSGTTGSSGSSSENNYSNKASLVYVTDVASAMQEIGVCSYNQFIHDCEMYGIAKKYGSVKASEMVGFIKWHYSTRSDISLNTAINNNYIFIIFTRPYSGEYYNVYTNHNYILSSSYACDYYIVFKRYY